MLNQLCGIGLQFQTEEQTTKQSHEVVQAIAGMLDVRLQYNPSIAGAMEMLQVPLHLKCFYFQFYLHCTVCDFIINWNAPISLINSLSFQ